MNLLGAMYSAILFLGALNSTTVQGVVSVERTVFYRERAAGMYSELPYAFSQVKLQACSNLIVSSSKQNLQLKLNDLAYVRWL